MKRKSTERKRPVRKLILSNFQSPGDIVMLTAAVRDLHRCYPGRFVTDVRTPCPDLWRNNPYLTPLKESGRGVEVVDCEYPLIHQSNQLPHHFLHGFIAFLNEKLGLQIKLTEFRGDIHLSKVELGGATFLSPRARGDKNVAAPVRPPFWIIVAGGKTDFTIKHWPAERYQEVVDYFAGRIQFVQVGEAGHAHPPLRGVIDLRGQTDLRQLVRLVYHAQGVLCQVTLLMHLAAAVPGARVQSLKSKVQSLRSGQTSPTLDIGHATLDFSRPCVVIAGGREPVAWEAYPGHQFLHTIGALPCCATGGCWRSRSVLLGDGDIKDQPDSLCLHQADGLPRCLDLITADDVVRNVELYFQGGACRYLTARSAGVAPAGSGGVPPPVRRGKKHRARTPGEPAGGDACATVKGAARGRGTLTRPADTLSTPKTLTPDPSPIGWARGTVPMGAGQLPRVFVVACNGAYYPGLMALLNSIWAYHRSRIPVFVYHRDMTGAQLEALFAHRAGVRLFHVSTLPFPCAGLWEAKQQIFAHCLGRARCVYLLDADVVLASEMEDVFQLAEAGKIVASADGGGGSYDARYAVYGPRLPGTRHPYINSGALCLDVVRHWDLAGLWAFSARYGAYSPGGGAPLGLPGHGDQGLFNALVALQNKTECFHVLPEGPWCAATKRWMLEIRRAQADGRLVVWNVTDQTRQRIVHCIGPKWWTRRGRWVQGRRGDKQKCFEHFGGLRTTERKGKRGTSLPNSQTLHKQAIAR